MSDADSSHLELRLEELLVEQTDRDLTFEEAREVQALLRRLPAWREDDVEHAAAAVLVAFAGERAAGAQPMPALPPSLREKIAQQAEAHLLVEHSEEMSPPRAAPARDDTIKRIPQPALKDAPKDPAKDTAQRGPKDAAQRAPKDAPKDPRSKDEPVAEVISIFSRAKIAIAVVALAASIAIAFSAGRYLRSETGAHVGADAAHIAWAPGPDPLGAGTRGEVVWSNSTQSGFMRFAGLPKNDATKLQYQLWIFDADRDDRYPVDGGVFDIAADSGEVIIPIHPKLHVNKATLFAITVERPGGVVVSSRERLVVLAKAG